MCVRRCETSLFVCAHSYFNFAFGGRAEVRNILRRGKPNLEAEFSPRQEARRERMIRAQNKLDLQPDDENYLGEFPPPPLSKPIVGGTGAAKTNKLPLYHKYVDVPHMPPPMSGGGSLAEQEAIHKYWEKDSIIQQAVQEAKMALRAINTKLPTAPTFGRHMTNTSSEKTDMQKTVLQNIRQDLPFKGLRCKIVEWIFESRLNVGRRMFRSYTLLRQARLQCSLISVS